MTALFAASKIARQKWVTTIADGGITGSGDMVKALTLAHAVMVGGLLAGCAESPWEVMEDSTWKQFKVYRGMGSTEAMADGSAARYGQQSSLKDKKRKLVPEGVVGKKLYIWNAADVLGQYVWGIQSGMGYNGAANLEELRARARYVRVSSGWQAEAKPHDLI